MASLLGSCVDLHRLVDSAALQHGSGVLHCVLDSLLRSHAIRVESAGHGCFIKAFFPKKANIAMCSAATGAGAASCCKSPSSFPSPISRTAMLRMRTGPGQVHPVDDVADVEPDHKGVVEQALATCKRVSFADAHVMLEYAVGTPDVEEVEEGTSSTK